MSEQCMSCGDDLFTRKGEFKYHHFCAEEMIDHLTAELAGLRTEYEDKCSHLESMRNARANAERKSERYRMRLRIANAKLKERGE